MSEQKDLGDFHRFGCCSLLPFIYCYTKKPTLKNVKSVEEKVYLFLKITSFFT